MKNFSGQLQTNVTNFNIFDKGISVISTLTNAAKTNFTQAIVIFHFKGNKLPIIAKSDLSALENFS